MSWEIVAWFLAGLAFLIVGADLVVRQTTQLAVSLGVRPLVLGLTVVAIGTSFPELAVGITASIQGSGSLAVGNIAGTNVFNILFILGLSALVKPLPLQSRILKFELPMIVVTAALMTVMAWDGTLTRVDGGILFGAAILYTAALIRISRSESRAVKEEFKEMYGGAPGKMGRRAMIRNRGLNFVLLVFGMGFLVLGADFLVTGAIDMARALGVTEAMIGLTIVAIGTSAPEIATTLVATFKDDRDVAVGNLLGSSIYNILVILALTCLIAPKGLPVNIELVYFDVPLMAGVAVACIPVFATGRRISRIEGGLFVTIYLTYLLFVIFFHK